MVDTRLLIINVDLSDKNYDLMKDTPVFDRALIHKQIINKYDNPEILNKVNN